jgi:hypothetical protein
MPRHEIETENRLVIVGWDDGLQTFFGQVWTLPEGDDADGPPELWVGVSWEEIATPARLAELLEGYATIPEDVIAELEKDYRNRRPLVPWQKGPKTRLLFTTPKNIV